MNNVHVDIRIMNMVQAKNERRSKIISERPATVLRHGNLHEALIAKAEAVIETRGLGALRARDLAAEAGCSVGAIYNVFSDLDGLILEVSATTLRQIDRTMAAVRAATPLQTLLGLAEAYLDYAVTHRLRWDALFSHRMPPGAPHVPWFDEVKDQAFSHIEAPLGDLRPDLDPQARRLLGRSIFAAVHGIVALGLDQRVALIHLPVLRAQIELVVRAIVHGLPSIKQAEADLVGL
jgi:AcrR family transcriptional regulator